MEKISAAVAWRLADRLRGGSDPKQQQSGIAEFVRMDSDGTAWVRIPGNDFDTPVEGGMYADAQEGDAVPYSIAGGQVAVTGNVTSPSVGQRVVDATIAPVRAAVSRATESIVMVRSIADAAKRVADAIDQHFWTDTSGIHVTHATQEDWAANQSGPNVLINSVGQLFRDGLNNLVAITTESGARAISFFDGAGNAAGNILAVFGADGVTLGRSTESHAYVDYHSLQMVDSGGNTYFHVSDLRDASGLYETVDTFVGNGAKILFPLSFKASNHDYTVKVDGVEVTSGIAKGLYQVDFTTAPSDGAVVTVEYATTSERAKAYTLGFRASGSKVGAMSLAEGLNVTASGEFSHAEGGSTQSTNSHCHAEGASTVASGLGAHSEGIYTVASGSYSHAQNDHTIAAKLSQTALGTYNVEDTATTTTHPDGFVDHGAYALIIGNGTSNDSRSNAITVDWDGNVDTAGGAELQDAVTVYSPTIEDDTTYSSNVGGNGLVMRNGSGTFVGQISAYAFSGADRLRGVRLGGFNEAATVYNNLYLLVDKDGNRKVQVSEAAAWLDMLGLSVSETTMTVNTTNTTTIGSNHVRRSGKVVTIYIIDLKIKASLANNTTSPTLATVPSGYRPAYKAYCAAVRASNIGSSYWRIDTDGALTLRNQSGSSFAADTTFTGTITYVIA